MIEIYGSPRTSAGRCYLLLEELGQPYKTMPLDMMEKREHKSPAYLKLNPNGKVPCLVDGDFILWESLAINYYLAEKYRPELLGSTPEEKGHVQQWSTWALSELQPPMVDLIIQQKFTPEEKRDPNVIARAREKIPLALKLLDQHLAGKKFLVNEKLTLADLNLASVVNISSSVQVSLEPFKNVATWLQTICERPSFKKLLAMRNS